MLRIYEICFLGFISLKGILTSIIVMVMDLDRTKDVRIARLRFQDLGIMKVQV